MKNYRSLSLVVGLAVIMFIFSLTFTGLVLAEDNSSTVFIMGPSGQKIPLDDLSSTERTNVVNALIKINKSKNKAEKIVINTKEVVKETKEAILDIAKNPKALNEWRKAITGTIKDVCNDLGVSVNKFIASPVGLGVAGIVIYKVAGKDFLSKFVDIALIIPVWFIMTIIIGVVAHKFLGSTTIYQEINETPVCEGGKSMILKKYPARTINYPWKSDEARTAFGVILFLYLALFNFFCLCIMFQ